MRFSFKKHFPLRRPTLPQLQLFLIMCLSVIILSLSIRGNYGNPTSYELNNEYWKDEGPLELSPERGRFALMYSIYEDHSFQFSLPVARFASPDVAIANGEFVSIFAPALSFIILPGYLVGKAIGLAQVGTYAVISIFALINVLLIRSIATKLGAHPTAGLLAGLIYLFASPSFAYAVSLYQHHVSVFLILLSIYVLQRWDDWKSLTIVWFICAFSIVLDNPNFFFMIPIGVFTLQRLVTIKETSKNIKINFYPLKLFTFAVMAIPLGAFMFINYKSYGNPFQLAGTASNADRILEQLGEGRVDFADKGAIEQATQDAAEDKREEQNITGYEDPQEKTALGFFKNRQLPQGFYTHFLSADRGMRMYTPVLLLGFIGLFLIPDEHKKYKQLLIATLGAVILLYSMWGDPWGGWAFGSRYMIPAYALLSIGLAVLLSKFKHSVILFLLVAVLTGYSIFVNTVGALTTNRIPPKIQVLALEEVTGQRERYTYTRGMEMLNQDRSKSFFFQTVANQYLTAWQFSIAIMVVIGVINSSLLFFAPLFFVGIFNAVDLGYMRGRLMFGILAISIFIDPLLRLLISVVLGELDYFKYVYLSVPISITASALVLFLFSKRGVEGPSEPKDFKLPASFFSQAMIAKLSTIAFFSLDNLLVAHYLSAEDTGRYGVLGLVGKMIFFAGSLIAGFILPVVSHKEGHGEDSSSVFNRLLLVTGFLSISAYLALGIGLPLISPFVLGEKFNSIRQFLPIYGLGILFYTISQAMVQFHLARKEYHFSIISFIIVFFQIAALWLFHQSLLNVVIVMMVAGLVNVLIISILHIFHKRLKAPLSNVQDFLDLFTKSFQKKIPKKDRYRILILNWRDTKHVWAGGAETYIQEIAKRLVKQGHKVTIFCGNDNKHPRNEVIEGVQIVRRGGFYTVYFWAFVYYVLRFRNTFDIIIDSENGIPFLSPMYTRKSIFLLIHHIHQDVFRQHLHFPLRQIASYIESDLMPFVYKDANKITVSASSKKEMISLGIGDDESIDIINPGIDTKLFSKKRKTKHPSLVYIGRLKPYKNIDTAISAFAEIHKKYPNAKFTIAGTGESEKSLKKQVEKLHIEKNVKFLGRVSDNEKALLFAKSWLAIQPSMIEGWGITVIEANACGTPVVASNVKGLKDSVIDGKTGILVSAKSKKAFVEAIDLLFTDTAFRKELSLNAYEWSKNYDWDQSAKNFISVVEKNIHRSIHFGTEPAPVNVYDK